MTTTDDKEAIRLKIPARFLLVPGAALVVGTTIGLVRGSRKASLRFLAENAHRPPTTVQGWYFYNKTKNYKVIYGGLKGAGTDAAKLTTVALGWVGMEEGLERLGWGGLREVGAGVGVAGVFSAVCTWMRLTGETRTNRRQTDWAGNGRGGRCCWDWRWEAA
ncbi:hypothetical protein H2248_006208 [Termitomyces sp. 'cryptogamus']|nr:hypothetical protein H2248_006208 [Termitomyces sp. 'cryptogamus']